VLGNDGVCPTEGHDFGSTEVRRSVGIFVSTGAQRSAGKGRGSDTSTTTGGSQP